MTVASTCAAATVVIVCWLPGAVGVPRADRSSAGGARARCAEERLFWQVIISVAVSLAWCSRWRRRGATASNACSSQMLPSLAWLRQPPLPAAARGGRARGPVWSCWCRCGLVLLGPWRFFPPSEYIIGGKDPGVYMSEGMQIAQRGALSAPDPVVSSVPNVRARSVFSLGATGRLLQRPLHGLLHPGARQRACRRPVPAPVSRVDRARLRPRRPDRRAAHDVSVGNLRRARRVLRWRAAGRPRRRPARPPDCSRCT